MTAPDKIWIEPAWAETFARTDGDPVEVAYIPESVAQAAVAAALEAAAGEAQTHLDHWRKAWEALAARPASADTRTVTVAQLEAWIGAMEDWDEGRAAQKIDEIRAIIGDAE